MIAAETEGVVLRYAVSALAGLDGEYRSLRTRDADVTLAALAPPDVWKDALREAHPDLPAPAVYQLETDVALPVEETLLPIAKRKLLALMTVRGEA